MMALDREVGSEKFNNKCLTSSCSPYRNALISALLSQTPNQRHLQEVGILRHRSRLHVTFVEGIAVQILSVSPNVLNSTKKLFKFENSSSIEGKTKIKLLLKAKYQ